MNEYRESEKAGERIIKILDSVTIHPVIIARVLHKAPGPIKHKLWRTIKLIILHWKIEAANGTYHKSESEIYEWVKKVNDE